MRPGTTVRCINSRSNFEGSPLNPFDMLIHLLDLFAPALGLGALAAALAKLLWWRAMDAVAWHWLGVWAAAASGVALLGGLAFFGRDGRMETYAVMVLASAIGLGWAASPWGRAA